MSTERAGLALVLVLVLATANELLTGDVRLLALLTLSIVLIGCIAWRSTQT